MLQKLLFWQILLSSPFDLIFFKFLFVLKKIHLNLNHNGKKIICSCLKKVDFGL